MFRHQFPISLAVLTTSLALFGISNAFLRAEPASIPPAIPAPNNPTTKPVAYPLDVCVTSGEKLGTMGDPIVRTIDDREVRFCCGGCAKPFTADIKAGHEKMDALIIAAGKDKYPLKTCIVSGEALPEAKDIIYYVHRPTNQLVAFCCSGCVKGFQADPQKYLSRLSQN